MSADARPPRPRPSAEGQNAEFYRRLATTRRLAFQRCAACGRVRHPPRLACPHCGSAEAEYAPSRGLGRIYSWTVTHQAFVPAFAHELPYAVVVSELEEGVRLVSGVRELTLAMLSLDLPIEVVLEEVEDGLVLPFVRPRRS
ncbi:MAG TPA: zinc ribbon domain-containing protein [Myxococcota bacterium]|nr:zinc ribbon domain-containing protein [Myxococcota bacterium]